MIECIRLLEEVMLGNATLPLSGTVLFLFMSYVEFFRT